MTARARCSCLALFVATAMLLSTRVAFAEDIGVVASDPADPFVARVVRELEHLGLSVARGSSVAGSRDVAVLEIGEGTLDLHESLVGEERKKRRLAARRDAVEVAEEVHALLLPLVKKAPAPMAPPVAPAASTAPLDVPVPVPVPVPATRAFGERDVELSAGAGAMLGSPSPGMSITFAGAFYPRVLRTRSVAFGASVGGIFAAAPEGVSRSAGTSDVRAYVGAAEAIARFGGASPIVVDTALGVSVNHVTFAGAANAPFTSRSESATSASPTLRARATYAFGRIGLFLDARTGFGFPEIAVRFAGTDVATWGRPWACLGGGVAFGF